MDDLHEDEARDTLVSLTLQLHRARLRATHDRTVRCLGYLSGALTSRAERHNQEAAQLEAACEELLQSLGRAMEGHDAYDTAVSSIATDFERTATSIRHQLEASLDDWRQWATAETEKRATRIEACHSHTTEQRRLQTWAAVGRTYAPPTVAAMTAQMTGEAPGSSGSDPGDSESDDLCSETSTSRRDRNAPHTSVGQP